jgi:uncharacterized protein YndB with AHSA1/START domain
MHVNGVFRVIEPPTGLIFSWNIEPPDEHAGMKSEVTVTMSCQPNEREARADWLAVPLPELHRGVGPHYPARWRA